MITLDHERVYVAGVYLSALFVEKAVSMVSVCNLQAHTRSYHFLPKFRIFAATRFNTFYSIRSILFFHVKKIISRFITFQFFSFCAYETLFAAEDDDRPNEQFCLSNFLLATIQLAIKCRTNPRKKSIAIKNQAIAEI